MISINFKALQEDARKVGIAVMLIGFANIFFSDASHWYSSYILMSGIFSWSLGVITVKEK